MMSLYYLLHEILNIYATVIVVRIITEWLFIFGLLNDSHQLIRAIWNTLYAITQPSFDFVHRSIGRYVPLQVGSVELTPLVVLLLIWFIQGLLSEYWGYLL